MRKLSIKANLLFAALAALAGCAQTNYQAYEGRGDQIIEGQGGTKEVVDGYEIWDNGTPPRRYKVIGVTTIEDFDNVFGNRRIRSAIAEQISAADGDAAVVVSLQGGSGGMAMAFGSNGGFAAGPVYGKKLNRYQIIKYLDKK